MREPAKNGLGGCQDPELYAVPAELPGFWHLAAAKGEVLLGECQGEDFPYLSASVGWDPLDGTHRRGRLPAPLLHAQRASGGPISGQMRRGTAPRPVSPSRPRR